MSKPTRSTIALVTGLALLGVGTQTTVQAAPVAPPMVLSLVATGLGTPVGIATRPGDDALYVIEQVGRIAAIRDGVVDPTPVLDISGMVSRGLEQGLLGLAFDPAAPDFFYINYTDGAGHTHIVEYQMDGSVADADSRRELMFIQQPFNNHNCGALRFGPDGHLYICTGDGGSAGDPGNRAQDLENLLGKILRIDPRGAVPYAIPADNPFVGDPAARDEVWAYGLRNPWQFSFDRLTGDMWIGDVGQNLWEEINFQPADSPGGENYGWNAMEATHSYEGGTEPANHTPPIFEYPHGLGCSITGGFVYRGERIAGAEGIYFFGDWCAGRVWTLGVVDDIVLPVPIETGLAVPSITAFGEDNDGELYGMTLTGQLFRIDPVLP